MRRHTLTLLKAPLLKRPCHVPAPAGREEGHGQECLDEHVAGQVRRHELEHLLQRETVLSAKRQDDAVIVGGGLQLEVKARQKRLRMASPQARMMRAPN